MQVIVIAGLAVVEKVALTAALAHHFVDMGQRVTVIDNSARLTLDSDQLPNDVILSRITDSIQPLPISMYDDIVTDIVLYVANETSHPDDLFIAVDEMRVQGLTITSVAVIDERTCDCFPQVRAALESNSDIVVNVPFDLQVLLEAFV